MKRESINISKVFLEEKNNSLKEEEEEEKRIKKEIEIKTVKILLQGIESGKITNPILEKDQVKQGHNQDLILTVLSSGAKEFKEKMGREMTYGEMREMFG